MVTLTLVSGHTPGGMNLDLTAYEDWLRTWGHADTTIAIRLQFARRLLNLWGTLDVDATTATRFLADHEGWTRRTYVAHMRSIYAWAVEAGHVERSPLYRYRRPPSPRPKPKPLDRAQVDAALETDDMRLRAWLLLGLLAGLRAHEIAKVHGRDVDERALFVRGKGGQEWMIPTHPGLWELAQQYPRDGYWFPSPQKGRAHVHPSLVSNRIRDHFRTVGITEGATHRLRHTYGTQLADDGTPIRVVQELMRHRSVETTMRYVGVSDRAMRDAVRRLGVAA